MIKYLLHNKTMHPATFYAETVEDVRLQVRRWITLACSPGTPFSEFRLEVDGKEVHKTSAMETQL